LNPVPAKLSPAFGVWQYTGTTDLSALAVTLSGTGAEIVEVAVAGEVVAVAVTGGDATVAVLAWPHPPSTAIRLPASPKRRAELLRARASRRLCSRSTSSARARQLQEFTGLKIDVSCRLCAALAVKLVRRLVIGQRLLSNPSERP
jgi:hypothetical protein